MYLNLNGNDWTIEGWLPKHHRFNMERAVNFSVGAIVPEIQANVPGSIHYDLYKAGIIDFPYYNDNSLKVEWVENKCWLYKKQFKVSKENLQKKAKLICYGVNFEGRFYLNNQLLGTHKNVHVPAEFDITNQIREENTIKILIENTPEEENQMGSTTNCRLQAQRFGYGWDFSTRLVGVGLFREVGVVFYKEALIDEVDIRTDVIDSKGIIKVSACATSISNFEVELSYHNQIIKRKVFNQVKEINYPFEVSNPYLWYPFGYGEQPLYHLSITLIHEEGIDDKKTYPVGIRKLEYAMNEHSAKEAIPYTIVINGKKIFSKGVNLIPFDQMLGRVDQSVYDFYFDRLIEGNVNLVRLWGGGVVESNYFHQKCDELGIMVWQDFMQTNSGLDGLPTMNEEFWMEFEKTTRYILKRNRNYVSTVIYNGGNELREIVNNERVPVGFNHPNIIKLAQLINEEDNDKIFHPSCPSGPNFSFKNDEKSKLNRLNHNVHGDWSYKGMENHYAYYNAGDYLYHGEFGVNGALSEESLSQLYPTELLEGYKDKPYNWRIKSVTWWDSYKRDCEIFGKENIDQVSGYVSGSQLIQAEGLRYIIERDRSRAFECSGCNVWQLNEPSPNPNCSSLIDYFKRPKMAYYYMKNAYKNINVNLKYSKLYYELNEHLDWELSVSNLGPEINGIVEVELINKKGVFKKLSFEVSVKENENKLVDKITQQVTQFFTDIFFIRLKWISSNEVLATNLYCFGTNKETPYAPLFMLDTTLDIKLNKNEKGKSIIIKNTGSMICPFIQIYPEQYDTDFTIEDNFITLCPNESKELYYHITDDSSIVVKDFARKINKLIK